MPEKDIKVMVNSEGLVSIPVLQLSIASSKVLNFLPSLSPKIKIPNRVSY